MKLWLDAHVSFRLAAWLEEELGVQAKPVGDLGLRHAKDLEISEAARESSVVVVTKDRDLNVSDHEEGGTERGAARAISCFQPSR